MKTITLKQAVSNQAVEQAQHFSDTRFIGDFEPLDSFSKTDFDTVLLADTEHKEDRLVEKALCIVDNDYFIITATHTSFNGQSQVNYIQQQLTLQGLNYYCKDLDFDMSDTYNNHLVSLGYEITVDDILELGEYLPQYNVTTLQFPDEKGNKHYLTVNKLHQLSKVTKKLSSTPVNTKTAFASAF